MVSRKRALISEKLTEIYVQEEAEEKEEQSEEKEHEEDKVNAATFHPP